ncbi:RNA recognition motif containing protein [Carpediemonas membranifera]|uniref:RNA recognition motif containing protein n=1 Tax=Carpediemonas membranifera TaxID=201153 RepID=A0A8J6BX58_9EUKA|nr:RNA recognition motif containing protein [Carpediemonas membranifera]|eukprot:KAG9393126.1 RNA recognition motif containing protein [Carpediemonas membranifera]
MQANGTAVYVADLHSDVTEQNIWETFQRCGPIHSVRVCRDSATRVSLGYCYVNFINAADAQKAIDDLTFTELNGQVIRVCVAERDPSRRQNQKGNIYIGNISPSVTARDIFTTFRQFGVIISARVCTGKNATHAFIHFADVEDAQRAVEGANGQEIEGMAITVQHFKTLNERGGAKFTNVYAKQWPASYTKEQVVALFSKYGKINSTFLPAVSDEEGAPLRGFGCFNFHVHEDAVKAIQELNGKQIEEGATLFVAKCLSRKERAKAKQTRMHENFNRQTNVFIKNIDEEVDDTRLHQLFGEFGEITSASVKRDEKGVSKGFGFINYTEASMAQRAIQEMMGKMIGSKPLYVALHQPKEIRRAQLAQMHQQQQAMAGMDMRYPGYPMQQPGVMMPYTMHVGRPAPLYPATVPRAHIVSATAANVPSSTLLSSEQISQIGSLDDRKQQYGNGMYLKVMPMTGNDQELCGQIVAAILENEEPAIVEIYNDDAKLAAKVEELKVELSKQ